MNVFELYIGNSFVNVVTVHESKNLGPIYEAKFTLPHGIEDFIVKIHFRLDRHYSVARCK